MANNFITFYENQPIRSVVDEIDGTWYFVAKDIILVLVNSRDPKQYLKKLRMRNERFAKEWANIAPFFPIETAGSLQLMACVNGCGLARLIQALPTSHRTRPYKQWLAQINLSEARLKSIDEKRLVLFLAAIHRREQKRQEEKRRHAARWAGNDFFST
ncbi:hypothetical protein AGMMS49965_16030 [Bacteroidia bacterium]|nr:hypothetical protein AGMMS49965_16030 [Bacteroidia bacterium]